MHLQHQAVIRTLTAISLGLEGLVAQNSGLIPDVLHLHAFIPEFHGRDFARFMTHT